VVQDVLHGRSRGSVSLEYALLVAAAVFGLLLGAAALAEGDAGPVERAIQRAAATVQGADAPAFSARGGNEGR
jgi:uncharacterized protein (UPF0333 family)